MPVRTDPGGPGAGPAGSEEESLRPMDVESGGGGGGGVGAAAQRAAAAVVSGLRGTGHIPLEEVVDDGGADAPEAITIASTGPSSEAASPSPSPSPASPAPLRLWRSLCGGGDRRRAGLMTAAITVTTIIVLVGLATRGLNDPFAPRSDGTFGGAVVAGASVRFLAVGDWGRQGKENQPEVAASMGAWAERLRPSFVLSVGDNFYEGGIPPGGSVDDPQFRSSFLDVYTHPALTQLPVYAIYGNHDYRGDMRAQIAFSGSPASRGRWRMPDLNQTLTVPIPAGRIPPTSYPATCLGLVLADTSPFISYYRDPQHWENWPQFGPNILAANTAAHLAWVKEEVAKAARQCSAVILVGHHPLYSAGEHGDSQDMIDAFKGTLDSAGVDVYLAGHDHTLVHLAKDGVDYIISGAGSRVRDNSRRTPETVWFADSTPGFTIHSANATHVATAFVDGRSGALLHVSVKGLRTKARG